MREWNLDPDDPGEFTLAADARCGPTDYTNDQIWRLNLSGGDPPALGLRTTYGLRARDFRLFPRFTEGDNSITDPMAFDTAPKIHRFYPNHLALSFSPFKGIDVQMAYWVPGSQAITGRIQVTNSRLTTRQLRLEWVALLTPSPGGERMAPVEYAASTVLSGQTEELYPVVFMTGGPQISSGPYPALAYTFELTAGSTRQVTWAHAALNNPDESFELTRRIAALKWEAEIARIEMLNTSVIDIQTGEPDWDAAFALSQKTAYSLFMSPTDHLKHPSYVHNRQPDQGYSRWGDGSDYNHLWNGQSVLESDYLTSLILPASPHLAKALLANYLDTQTQTGFVDWKPGLAGQRSQMLATPLLVYMAWNIFQATQDQNFLAENFDKLLKFIEAWFLENQDRDRDGIPEWSHPIQSGYEDHPAFSQWQSWAQGADITKVESPALCALLYNEITTLVRIAEVLGKTGPIPMLMDRAETLRHAVGSSWDENQTCYKNWDRESHFSSTRERLGERRGSGEIIIQREFDQPIRLVTRIQTGGEPNHQARIFIHGAGATGGHRVESLGDESFLWFLALGRVTSQRLYSSLERIEIQGLDEHDVVTVEIMDLSALDHSLLLPLWAGIPDEVRAQELIEKTIASPEGFWFNYGFPACPKPPPGTMNPACIQIDVPWNNLIGEGLLRYGYREPAASLVTKIMQAIIQSLKHEKSFRRYYHAETGDGSGEANALGGLAPLRLFMHTLGLELISSKRIHISGYNPYPWPVTIRFQGLTVIRNKKQIRVTFPNGQTAIVNGPEPRIISIDQV